MVNPRHQFDEALDLVWNDIETKKSNISYFENLMKKYSRNDTTMLDMASSITAANHSHLEEALSTILTQMDIQALEPLRNMIRNSKVNIKEWLHSSLNVTGRLLPYSSSMCIERRIQIFLKIWLYPVLKLDSPDVLVFNLRGDEIWPRTKRLQTLLENNDHETVITEILRSFGNDLSFVKYDLRNRLLDSKKETLTALGNLTVNAQAIHQQSIIDKDFIL